jgi:hypothetical protein
VAVLIEQHTITPKDGCDRLISILQVFSAGTF